MRTLILGAGALGGLIGARLAATGARVSFAVRDRASAERLRQAGFRVSGEKMMVDPIPPGWDGRAASGPEHEARLARILDAYGDLKPSMLQDFERGRVTEIDFINGYVAELGRRLGVPTPVNAAIVETVHAIEQRRVAPEPELLEPLARARHPRAHQS